MSALTDRDDVTMTGLDDVREAPETTTAPPARASPGLLGVTGGGPATAAELVDGPWLEELLDRVTGSGVRLTGQGGFGARAGQGGAGAGPGRRAVRSPGL